MGMRRHLTTPLLVVALLAGCGETPPSHVPTTPAAQRQTTTRSSIVVRGDYAPDQHGPFTFSGRYAVRFVQRGAAVDFRREVPFTAHLEQPDAAGPPRTLKLFQAAA